MKLISRDDPSIIHFAREVANARYQSASPANNLQADDLFLWQPPASNIVVTEDIALNYSAVWAATSLLCSLSGILPLSVWTKQNGKMRPDPKHRLHRLIARKPNNVMSPYDIKSLLTRGQINSGNGYAEIVRNGAGEPVQILPIRPHRVTSRIVQSDDEFPGFDKGELAYEISFDGDEQSLRQGNHEGTVWLHAEDVLDFRSKLTYEGITGMGVISFGAEGIGAGIQAERFGAKYFGREGMPRIIVNILTKMNPEAQKDFRKQWKDIYGQNSNPEDVAILPGAEAKIHVLDLNPNDAELLNTRKFSVEEIARWYGVPPHLLQLMMNGGNVSLEQLGVEFVNYSLMPWLTRQQEELELKLLTEKEMDAGVCIRYDVDNLQKGDLASRVSAYSKMMQYGFTLNEVLEKEGLPPVDKDGDVRFFPANMTTMKSVIAGTNLKALHASGRNTDGRNTEDKDADDPDPQNVAGPTAATTRSAEELEAAWLKRIQERFDYKATQAVERLRQKGEPFAKVEEFYAKHTRQHQEEIEQIPGCIHTVDYTPELHKLKGNWRCQNLVPSQFNVAL